MTTIRRKVSGWMAIAAFFAFAPVAARAEREAAEAAYLRYCGACHGESGKGDGAVSSLMRPKPTDLTGLAKANKGDLPYGALMQIIDGRQTIRAHGDPDMPVWGEIFKAEAGRSMAQEAVVRGKLLLIIEHLGSIQQK